MLEPRRGRQVGGAAEHRRDAAEGAVEAAAGRYLVGHGAVAQVGAGVVAARIAQFLVGEQVPVVGCLDVADLVPRAAAGAFPRPYGVMPQGRPAAADTPRNQIPTTPFAQDANPTAYL